MLSVVLWVVLTRIAEAISLPFVFGLTSIMLGMVPGWSMIFAAVGAPTARKLQFFLVPLALMLAFYLVAYFTGWHEAALNVTADGRAEAPTLVMAFRLIRIGGPVAMLVLFVGKQPSVFWEPPEG